MFVRWEFDFKNSKANNSTKNNGRAGEVECIATKSENTELERKIKELEQINIC